MLTLAGDLTWNGGGVIRLVLGTDEADSDRVDVLGSVVRGSAGTFRFDLVDAGITPG